VFSSFRLPVPVRLLETKDALQRQPMRAGSHRRRLALLDEPCEGYLISHYCVAALPLFVSFHPFKGCLAPCLLPYGLASHFLSGFSEPAQVPPVVPELIDIILHGRWLQ